MKERIIASLEYYKCELNSMNEIENHYDNGYTDGFKQGRVSLLKCIIADLEQLLKIR